MYHWLPGQWLFYILSRIKICTVQCTNENRPLIFWKSVILWRFLFYLINSALQNVTFAYLTFHSAYCRLYIYIYMNGFSLIDLQRSMYANPNAFEHTAICWTHFRNDHLNKGWIRGQWNLSSVSVWCKCIVMNIKENNINNLPYWQRIWCHWSSNTSLVSYILT